MSITNTSIFNQTRQEDKMLSIFSLYLSEAETVVDVFVVLFFGSAGFLQNLVLILSIILTDGYADAPSNVFVLSLAFGDLLLSGMATPLFIFNFYHSVFAIFMTACRLIVVAITGSIFVLTLNRLVSIVRPMTYPKIMTFKRTVTLVGVVWFLAIFVFVLAVVGLLLDIKPMTHITRYLNLFYITSSTVMCVYMYCLGRKHRKRLAQQIYAVTGQMQATSDELRALRSLFMVAGSFVASWLPVTIAVFFIDAARDPAQYYRAICFTAPCCFANAVIDPVVYYYRSRGFRSSLKKLIRRCRNDGCCQCWY